MSHYPCPCSQLHVTLARQTVLAHVPRLVMTGTIESTNGKQPSPTAAHLGCHLLSPTSLPPASAHREGKSSRDLAATRVDVLGLLRISSPSQSQSLSELDLSIIFNGVSYTLDQTGTQAVRTLGMPARKPVDEPAVGKAVYLGWLMPCVLETGVGASRRSPRQLCKRRRPCAQQR